jgi:hypothetical protein
MADLNETTKTEWNSSMACLMRLDSLLTDANDLKRACTHGGLHVKELKLYKQTTRAIFDEISPKLSKKEIKTIAELLKHYDRYIITKKKQNQYGDVTIIIDPDNFDKAYRLIESIELYLRKQADKKGMLIHDKAGDEW